jgi:hypothetical protein
MLLGKFLKRGKQCIYTLCLKSFTKHDYSIQTKKLTTSNKHQMTKTLSIVVAGLLLSVAAPATAGDFNNVRQLSQDAFLRLSKDLASVTALRALSPGVTLNLLGFDLGMEVGVAKVDNTDIWKKAGGGSTDVITPRLTIHKGLAAGFDIGASIGAAGGSGTQTVGAILRYQLVEPRLVLPGATLRLTGNREVGASKVNVRSLGADFVIAKPLVVITPYVGIGAVRTDTSAPGTTLSSVTVNRTRTFVGFDTRLAFATISAEAEKIGNVTTISSKLGFRF